MAPSGDCIEFVQSELARGPQPMATLLRHAERQGFTLGMVLMAVRAVMDENARDHMRVSPAEEPLMLRAG